MTKRQLIYVPEINPRTFLLFFFRGHTGRSYSFRDYTVAAGVNRTDAKHYPYAADEIITMARHSFDAPARDTNDLDFWRRTILELNQKHLTPLRSLAGGTRDVVSSPMPSEIPAVTLRKADSGESSPAPRSASAPFSIPGSYPVFALRELLAHPAKGAKTQDLQRIFSSRRSEDWVTWNVVKLLSLIPAHAWWPAVLDLAREDNPRLTISADENDVPQAEPWICVAAPSAYERQSRARMAQSGQRDWVARSSDTRAVEGTSEIDIVLTMQRRIGFIEAKLGSDISMSTTYDPRRNQIARNIDCLLEVASGRAPFFWMLTADRGPGRAYTQVLQRYRQDPGVLASELPHRSPDAVSAIVRDMAVLLWKDVLRIVRLHFDQVWDEIQVRVAP